MKNLTIEQIIDVLAELRMTVATADLSGTYDENTVNIFGEVNGYDFNINLPNFVEFGLN